MSCCRKQSRLTAWIGIIFILTSLVSGCQSSAPDTLPAVKLLHLDSATAFNTAEIPKGQPVLLIYFRPYCKHCREETEAILDNFTSFKDTQIVFVSADQLDKVKLFARYYQLDKYRNVHVVLDSDFNFFKSFKPREIPYQAIYNSSQKLVKEYNGEAKWTELIKALQGD